jgi:hypothetical protein
MKMRVWLAAAAVACAGTATLWAQVPRGPEFGVNAYVTGNQFAGSVASDAAGNFVLAWSSAGQDGSSDGVFARRFLSSGTPVGAAEFRANVFTASNQSSPAAALRDDGNLVLVWESLTQDGSQEAVVGHRFDGGGTPQGEFLVNQFTTGVQSGADAAADASGGFVVVWQSTGQDGAAAGVFGRRYDAVAGPLGPEFPVNSYTSSTQLRARVTAAPDGRFVVVWAGAGNQDPIGVFAQRYDATGAAVGPEFRVNNHTDNAQLDPDVAMDAAGNFVVVWRTSAQFDGDDIMARRYDASGVPTTAEFRVNVYTTAAQELPVVAADARGGFVVAWAGAGQGDPGGIFARRYEATGEVSPEFRVNEATAGEQAGPRVAMDATGDFVVAWTSLDGSGYGVAARRYRSELIFADGFDVGGLSAWSSSNTDGGDLAVSSAAALDFTVAGLQAQVDDTAGLFVQDDTPEDEARYRVRFHLDSNGFDPGEAEDHRRTRVFIAFSEAPMRRVAAVVLRRLGGVYAIMGRARLDDNSQADTGFSTVSDDPHVVEFDLNPASGPGTADGSFELRIDGAPQATLTGLDNSLARVDLARMGALSVKTGAAGTIYWDGFQSWRTPFPAP